MSMMNERPIWVIEFENAAGAVVSAARNADNKVIEFDTRDAAYDWLDANGPYVGQHGNQVYPHVVPITF